MNYQPGHQTFNSTNLLLFFYKWRKPLLWVFLIASIGSAVFSLFIPSKYRSTVILYPAATSTISQSLLAVNRNPMQKGILDFGVDEETEQMLQILNSNRIRDRIIEEFNLEQHYGIKPNTKYRLSKLHRKYENNITFKRTEFMAVKISVLDTDPKIAADIANRIADLLDSTRNEIQQERAKKAYEVVKKQYFKLLDEMQQMEDTLTKLRQLGVHDYESQSEALSLQLAAELAKNNTAGVQKIQEQLNILAKYGGAYVNFRDRLEFEREKLSLLKARYEEAKTDAEEVLPTKFIVNRAYPAERKTYPIRWLIVMVTTFSALLLTILVILFLENVREYIPGALRFTSFTTSGNNNSFQSNSADSGPPQENNPDTHFPTSSNPENFSHSHHESSSSDYNQQLNEIKTIVTEVKSTLEKHLSSANHMTHSDNSSRTQTLSTDNTMSKLFTNLNLLKILFKWRIHLGIILLISVILAVIFSSPLFITPKYKSFAIVYPSNLSPYSEESESEQMLQFLQSRDIRDQLIRKYDLPRRYKIDSSYRYFQSAIDYEYSRNVKFSKTPYESILIEVYDADPVIACKMVEDIINFFNQKVLTIHREKYREIVDFLTQRLDLKKAEIDSVQKVHSELRINYNIIDFPNQSREVTRGFLRTVDGNNAAANINTPEVLRLKKNLEEFGGKWIYYNDRLFDLVEEYGKIKMQLDEALMNYNKYITYTNVITAPYPADKKSYPIRWIIVAVTVIGVFMVSTLVFLVLENYESIKQNI